MSILAADSLWQKHRPGGTAFRSFIRMTQKPTVSIGTICVVVKKSYDSTFAHIGRAPEILVWNSNRTISTAAGHRTMCEKSKELSKISIKIGRCPSGHRPMFYESNCHRWEAAYICRSTYWICRGVDNGAAGAATAAPIIWLVAVIQKWRGFRRPTHILPCTFSKRLRRSARTWLQRISQKYVIILLFRAMIALMISVFIAAIITRLSWCLFNPRCSSILIGKNLFCFVTGNW